MQGLDLVFVIVDELAEVGQDGLGLFLRLFAVARRKKLILGHFVDDLQRILGLKDRFSQVRVMERLQGRLHRLLFDLVKLLFGRLLVWEQG